MRRIALSYSVILGLGLMVAGCDPSSPPPQSSSISDPDTTAATQAEKDKANDAVGILLKACKYKASFNPILKIVMKSLPGLSTADEIANAVCETAKSANTIEGKGSVPTVGGVPIQGRFVR